MQQNKLLDSLQTLQMPLPSFIEAIHDPMVRQKLTQQHQQMTQQNRNEMMKSYMNMADTYYNEIHKLYHQDITKFVQDQRILPIDQRFNKMILNLIEERFNNITEKLQSVYNYRRYQSFGTMPMQ